MNQKYIILVFAILWFTGFTYGQVPPVVDWFQTVGGPDSDLGKRCAISEDGSVVYVGTFEGDVDFDPSPAEFNLYSEHQSICIVKFDSNGNFVWAKAFLSQGDGAFGSNPYWFPNQVEIGRDGNIVISGFMDSSIDFDPGAGEFVLSAIQGFFVAKLDSNGALIWAGNGHEREIVEDTGFDLDEHGNVYVCGYMSDGMNLEFGTSQYISGSDPFIIKLDGDNGSLLWVKRLTGTWSHTISAIQVNSTGDIFTSGGFRGTVDFDLGPGMESHSSPGSYNVYVSKMDSSGTHDWTRVIAGVGNEIGWELVLDYSENIIVAGTFSDSLDLDFGSNELMVYCEGRWDGFVVKISSTGDFVWGNAMASTREDNIDVIVTDKNDNVYLVGWFYGECDFDINTTKYRLSALGLSDGFVQALSPIGNTLWLRQVGGDSTFSVCTGLGVNGAQDVIVSGWYSRTIKVITDDDSHSITSNGYSDGLLLKIETIPVPITLTETYLEGPNEEGYEYQWVDCDNNYAIIPEETYQQFYPLVTGNYALRVTLGNSVKYSDCTHIEITENHDFLKLYPNPCSTVLVVERVEESTPTIEIFNELGTLVYSSVKEYNRKRIDVSKFITGNYILRSSTDAEIINQKFIKF